jgi:hypothetical protein
VELQLTIPETWTLVDATKRIWRVAPDVVVQTYPLFALPDHWPDAIAPFLALDLPAGASLRRVAADDGKTALGSPLHLERVEVVAAGAAGVLEERLAALYLFQEWGGRAVVRAAGRGVLGPREAELIDVLKSGRPSYRGHIAALEQIFE